VALVKPSVMRALLAFVAGLIAWVLVATILNRLLRGLLPGYTAAEPAMAFTTGMLSARLAIAFITSVAAGALSAALAPRSAWVPWALGVFLLAVFVPEHVKLWHVFPAWYHLAFLLTLAPLVALCGRLWSGRAAVPGPAGV
jgi:hypothetical protein